METAQRLNPAVNNARRVTNQHIRDSPKETIIPVREVDFEPRLFYDQGNMRLIPIKKLKTKPNNKKVFSLESITDQEARRYDHIIQLLKTGVKVGAYIILATGVVILTTSCGSMDHNGGYDGGPAVIIDNSVLANLNPDTDIKIKYKAYRPDFLINKNTGKQIAQFEGDIIDYEVIRGLEKNEDHGFMRVYVSDDEKIFEYTRKVKLTKDGKIKVGPNGQPKFIQNRWRKKYVENIDEDSKNSQAVENGGSKLQTSPIEEPQTQTIPQTQQSQPQTIAQSQPEKELEEIIVTESPFPKILPKPVKNSKPRLGVIEEDATDYVPGPDVPTFTHDDITYHIFSFGQFSKVKFSRQESKNMIGVFVDTYERSFNYDGEKLNKLLTPLIKYYMFEHGIKKESDFTPPEILDLVSLVLCAFTEYNGAYAKLDTWEAFRSGKTPTDAESKILRKHYEVDKLPTEKILENKMDVVCRNTSKMFFDLFDYLKKRFNSPYINKNLKIKWADSDNHAWNEIYYNFPGDANRIGILVLDTTFNDQGFDSIPFEIKAKKPFVVKDPLSRTTNIIDDSEDVEYFVQPSDGMGYTSWDPETKKEFFNKWLGKINEDFDFRLMLYTHFREYFRRGPAKYHLDFLKEEQVTRYYRYEDEFEPEKAIKIWDFLLKRKNIFVSELISDKFALDYIKKNPDFAEKVRKNVMPVLENLIDDYSDKFNEIRNQHGCVDVRNFLFGHLKKIYSSLGDTDKIKGLVKDYVKNLDDLVQGSLLHNKVTAAHRLIGDLNQKICDELENLFREEAPLPKRKYWVAKRCFNSFGADEVRLTEEAKKILLKNPELKQKVENRTLELIEEYKKEIKEFYDSTFAGLESKKANSPLRELINSMKLFLENKTKKINAPDMPYYLQICRERVKLSYEHFSSLELSDIAKEIKSDEVKQILFDAIFSKNISYKDAAEMTGFNPKPEFRIIYGNFENRKEDLKKVNDKELVDKLIYAQTIMENKEWNALRVCPFLDDKWKSGFIGTVWDVMDFIDRVKSGKITGEKSALSIIPDSAGYGSYKTFFYTELLFDLYSLQPIDKLKNDYNKLKGYFKILYDNDRRLKYFRRDVEPLILECTRLPLTKDKHELLKKIVYLK